MSSENQHFYHLCMFLFAPSVAIIHIFSILLGIRIARHTHAHSGFARAARKSTSRSVAP
jgi:hypothetical protein